MRERTDILDTLGNTTAATGKGFAIGSAALTALAMIASFMIMVAAWIRRSDEPIKSTVPSSARPGEGEAAIGTALGGSTDVTAIIDSRSVGLMEVVQAYDISW